LVEDHWDRISCQTAILQSFHMLILPEKLTNYGKQTKNQISVVYETTCQKQTNRNRRWRIKLKHQNQRR
jgi:hypothetical protein